MPDSSRLGQPLLYESQDIELGFRVCSWVVAENMYGWGAWEEPGERLPA